MFIDLPLKLWITTHENVILIAHFADELQLLYIKEAMSRFAHREKLILV